MSRTHRRRRRSGSATRGQLPRRLQWRRPATIGRGAARSRRGTCTRSWVDRRRRARSWAAFRRSLLVGSRCERLGRRGPTLSSPRGTDTRSPSRRPRRRQPVRMRRYRPLVQDGGRSPLRVQRRRCQHRSRNPALNQTRPRSCISPPAVGPRPQLPVSDHRNRKSMLAKWPGRLRRPWRVSHRNVRLSENAERNVVDLATLLVGFSVHP